VEKKSENHEIRLRFHIFWGGDRIYQTAINRVFVRSILYFWW